MRKRLVVELRNLRDALGEEYRIDDYPVDLLLGFRKPVGRGAGGWHALALDRERLNYRRLARRGTVDVIFHHLDSGVMVVSPSLSSGLHWRVIYPSDGVLCAHSIYVVIEVIRVRYEIEPPPIEWMRAALERETPWYVTPIHEYGDSDAGLDAEPDSPAGSGA